MVTQPNWRWCNKCQGIWFAQNLVTGGKCPAGGAHNTAGSRNYALNHYLNNESPGAPVQLAWRWCNKCQGLFFGGSTSTGYCPAAGGHDFTNSGNYGVENFHDVATLVATDQGNNYAPPPSPPPPPPDVLILGNSNLQFNWQWCYKCQGMFYFGGTTSGTCFAGGGHDSKGSGAYQFAFT